MESVIRQMYYGKLAPYAELPERDKRAIAAQERYDRAYDAFVNKLEPHLRREFQQILEIRTEESSYDLADSFVQGYRLGARMMLDALMCG